MSSLHTKAPPRHTTTQLCLWPWMHQSDSARGCGWISSVHSVTLVKTLVGPRGRPHPQNMFASPLGPPSSFSFHLLVLSPPPTADTPSRIMVKVFPGLGVNSPSHVQPYWGLPFHPWTLLTAFLKKVWSRMNFLVAYKAEGFTWKEGRRAECVGALGLPQPQGL